MEIRTLKEKIVCSGALFYAKSTARVLLLQKKSGKHAGTWGLVGGTNIIGENPWQGYIVTGKQSAIVTGKQSIHQLINPYIVTGKQIGRAHV